MDRNIIYTREVVDAMTEEEVDRWKEKIDAMSHEDMARLWRFAPAGKTPYFVSGTRIEKYFREKYTGLGEMTTELSKKIGWD